MYQIRKGELKDFTSVKNLMLEGLKEDPTAFSVSSEEYAPHSEYWWMGYINPFLTNNLQEMLLAFEEEKLFGMIGLTYDSKQRKKHIGSIVWFYVTKAKRGKGIGKDLINKALKILEDNSEIAKISLLVVATQLKAIEIYKRLGFEINGTLKKELKIDNDYLDVLLMEKEI
ncbi:MAG: GNAT family N-acetyltransferase [Candidatus Dojkabacteria bacterium]